MIKKPNVLMLYIEPTPYVLGLIDRLRERSEGEIRVLFVGANLTQPWGLDVENDQTELLPSDPRAAKGRIRALIRSGEFQAVHLAGWGHSLLLSTMIYAWMKGIPSLVESDTPRPPVTTPWKAIVKKTVYPIAFRAPAMFLPGGTRQAKYLRDFGVPERKMTIAQMTVDTVSISKYVDSVGDENRQQIRERLGIPNTAVVFAYVGRLESFKGVMTLLNSFSQLNDSVSVSFLLIVGDGALSKEIQKKADSSSHMSATGRLAGNDLLDCYAVSDVLVLPSLFEPWGLVVNEALAAGMCIIASDRVGCVDDLVKPSETGLIVPADSESALLDAMMTLTTNKALRKTMQQHARELVKDWSLEAEADIVVESWQKVICK